MQHHNPDSRLKRFDVEQSPSNITNVLGILHDQSCAFGVDVFEESPGFVPDLSTCAELCEASSRCTGASLYSSGFCNHYNTCNELTPVAGTATVVFEPETKSAVDWVLVGYAKECDADEGEISLQNSPGETDTLSQCLDSCEESSFGCTSISFLAGGFCNHFSTACDTTKLIANVASFRIVRDDAVTAKAWGVANMQQHVLVSTQSSRAVIAATNTVNAPHLVSTVLVLILTSHLVVFQCHST